MKILVVILTTILFSCNTVKSLQVEATLIELRSVQKVYRHPNEIYEMMWYDLNNRVEYYEYLKTPSPYSIGTKLYSYVRR